MLKAIGLRKEFNDKVALTDITLTLPEKGLVVIKGESGSGKTTLLNILSANDFPTSGKIEYQGVEITPQNAEKFRMQYCGNIYQDYMLIEDLSVKENIELALQVVGQDYTIDDIKTLLQKVDLPEEYLDKKIIKMSGGEKQRVAIARAIAKQNAIIFADEPTGNLDSKTGVVIMQLLKTISQERLVVVVSHNEKFNKKYADYTIKLADGEIKYNNIPSEPTEIHKSEIKTANQIITDKKSPKFRPKTLARLAYWGFEKNKIKSVLSILAFIILCMLSTVMITVASLNHNLALAKTLDNCTQRNVMIKKAEYADGESIEKFCLKSSYKSSLVYKFYFGVEENDVLDYEEGVEGIEYAIVYDEKVGADTKILYGSFPAKANEIALPYNFALFMTKYFKQYLSDNIADLIGKDLVYAEYYHFKIAGIFDEGRYIDDYKELSDSEKSYLKTINFMSKSVFFGKGIEEIFNKNGSDFYYAPAKRRVGFYNDKLIQCYGYDEYAPYGSKYPELKKGEIYINRDMSFNFNLKEGDKLTLDMGYYTPETAFKYVNTVSNLTVKGIIDNTLYFDSIVFSIEDYEKYIIPDGNNKYNVEALFFNAKDIKNSYMFFDKLDKEAQGVLSESKTAPNLNVMLQNLGIINNIYKLSVFYRRITIPLACVLFVGMMAMGAVSSMYLMASKEKSYNILRAIGCGRKNISLILCLQLFTVAILELIIGLVFAKVLCVGLSNIIISNTLSVDISLISEEILIIGWMPPIIVIAFILLQTFLSIAIKIKYMFSKSIMEYKTN